MTKQNSFSIWLQADKNYLCFLKSCFSDGQNISGIYLLWDQYYIHFWCLEKLRKALTLKCDTWHTLNDVTPAGNEAVGKESSVSFKSGWTAEAHRLPGLEVVEVPSETAAARDSLFSTFSRLTSLYALRSWILQPGDSSGLDILCKVHVEPADLCACGYEHCVSPTLAIEEEWQRTQCMPRETCVDVAKELGTDLSIFFKPPCVSVHRFVWNQRGELKTKPLSCIQNCLNICAVAHLIWTFRYDRMAWRK